MAAFLARLPSLLLLGLPLVAGRVRGPWRALVDWLLGLLDVQAHFQGSFLTGALDSAHVVFFLAWTAFLIFLAIRLLESKRWAR